MPDPSRVNAIKNMPTLTNVSCLDSFLRLANYRNYIPNMPTPRAPFNKFLEKDVKWNRSVDCQKAFDNLKTALTSDLPLSHYDPDKESYVASDASNLGLGDPTLIRRKRWPVKGRTSCFEEF